jgi:hypothetical protein
MDSSFSQLVYRSIFAAHCKQTKKSNNVSSKIALFEKLRYNSDFVVKQVVDVDPKPLKVSNNSELLKAYSLFNNSSSNSDCESTTLLDFSSDKLQSIKKNLFCSTPRDEVLVFASPNNSIFSSDHGIVDDCTSEINSILSSSSSTDNKSSSTFSNSTLSETRLIDKSKKVKQTAIKLNRQRKLLLENDKLIR